jgi:DNA-binding MarR family transcriptional regulator
MTITQLDFEILRVIQANRSITVTKISKEVGSKQSAISRKLQSLADAEFIDYKIDKETKRSMRWYYMTKDGDELMRLLSRLNWDK